MDLNVLCQQADFIIVGAGPAGASAAQALVEAGRRVLLLEAGDRLPTPAADALPDYMGEDAGSPKLRDPRYAAAFADWRARSGIACDNFSLWGMAAIGGLSNAWGGGIAEYSDEELQLPDIPPAMRESYRRLSQRLTVIGAIDHLADFYGRVTEVQTPRDLHRNTIHFLKNNVARNNWRAGQVRACIDDMSAIVPQPYNAATTIAVLQKNELFTLVTKCRAAQVASDALTVEHAGQVQVLPLRPQQLLLASGTIATTALVMAATRTARLRLRSSPSTGFALVFPELLWRCVEDRPAPAAMGEASFLCPLGGSYAFGNLIAPDAVAPVDLIGRVPGSVDFARQVLRFLEPGLLLGNVFLDSDYSRHEMRRDAHGAISLQGGYGDDYAAALEKLRGLVAAAAHRRRGIVLPGSFAPTPAGSDIHYAATLPMRAAPQAMQTSALGELAELKGIHMIDGSVLPCLPAKAHTWTIMANADRIARQLATHKFQ